MRGPSATFNSKQRPPPPALPYAHMPMCVHTHMRTHTQKVERDARVWQEQNPDPGKEYLSIYICVSAERKAGRVCDQDQADSRAGKQLRAPISYIL